MDRTRRLLAAIVLVSLAMAACSPAAQHPWTWPPADGTGSDQLATAHPTEAPTGSTGPISVDLRPDPNAPFYVLRDPKAPARLAGTTHDIDLYVDERFITVAEGLVREVWAFGGTVPGPVIRVEVGDTIRIHLTNRPPKLPGRAAWMHPAVNDHSHSVEFHGSTGASSDEVTSTKPGAKGVYEFKAEHAGVWIYACGTEPVLEHLANGMYGMVIVEPEGGLDEVDQEFFFVQSEWYLGGPNRSASLSKASSEVPTPDFVVLNGIADQYEDHPIQVETGRRVRAFILDAGPRLGSSFRVVGTTFNRVEKDGIELEAGDEGNWGSRTVDLSPGHGAMVEFTLAEDGLYPIETNALDVVGRETLGLFQAGDGDPFN
ncbi:MAG TPA: multicopper oxidase domain-containing protein [Candidatus Limnocylindrales bacterium]|nr:multicopper oxidase domain-containing protein [Candidatus Limnocylindrales bacterium]